MQFKLSNYDFNIRKQLWNYSFVFVPESKEFKSEFGKNTVLCEIDVIYGIQEPYDAPVLFISGLGKNLKHFENFKLKKIGIKILNETINFLKKYHVFETIFLKPHAYYDGVTNNMKQEELINYYKKIGFTERCEVKRNEVNRDYFMSVNIVHMHQNKN